MTIHLKVTGIVQGVGFRQFVLTHAKKTHLTGWVQNMPDNSVEIEIQGEEKNIKEFTSKIQNGSPASEIDGIISTFPEKSVIYTEFKIL